MVWCLVKHKENFTFAFNFTLIFVKYRTHKCRSFFCSEDGLSKLGITYFPIQLVLRALSPGLKRPELEVDHSPHVVPS